MDLDNFQFVNPNEEMSKTAKKDAELNTPNGSSLRQPESELVRRY